MKTGDVVFVTSKSHPAYRRYGKIRRTDDDNDMALIEWTTWAGICTWVFKSKLKVKKEKVAS